MSPENRDGLIMALCRADISFIVVGGMAAVLQGAPIVTHDLDIVHRRSSQNLDNLLELLANLDARHREQPAGRVLKPTMAEISGSGHLNLSTDLGPLDVLCELERGEGYEQLLPHTDLFSDSGVEFRVLRLEKLIEIKSSSGRAKDRLSLPALLAALRSRPTE